MSVCSAVRTALLFRPSLHGFVSLKSSAYALEESGSGPERPEGALRVRIRERQGCGRPSRPPAAATTGVTGQPASGSNSPIATGSALHSVEDHVAEVVVRRDAARWIPAAACSPTCTPAALAVPVGDHVAM